MARISLSLSCMAGEGKGGEGGGEGRGAEGTRREGRGREVKGGELVTQNTCSSYAVFQLTDTHQVFYSVVGCIGCF